MTREARHLSVSIECAPAQAYAWLSIPENFPQWAAGPRHVAAAGGRRVDGGDAVWPR